MAMRDILGLLLSILVVVAMAWGCSFKIEQIMMGELVAAAGGKYKFLTILNMVSVLIEDCPMIALLPSFSIFNWAILPCVLSISFSGRMH
jgi:hypothetical protein